jgi:hypothetical protein
MVVMVRARACNSTRRQRERKSARAGWGTHIVGKDTTVAFEVLFPLPRVTVGQCTKWRARAHMQLHSTRTQLWRLCPARGNTRVETHA